MSLAQWFGGNPQYAAQSSQQFFSPGSYYVHQGVPTQEAPTMQLYEYVIVYIDNDDDHYEIVDQQTEEDTCCDCKKSYCLTLAKDEATARIEAARAIPEGYDISKIVIYVRRWGS